MAIMTESFYHISNICIRIPCTSGGKIYTHASLVLGALRNGTIIGINHLEQTEWGIF